MDVVGTLLQQQGNERKSLWIFQNEEAGFMVMI